ncbi:MAG TPA: lytic transglycosylase domain-containing protein [Patescibacteria group bacterium]|jgi:soluble lytic murein transglycosylase-like protein|nr:lytic transglycosylase domain-containing protein [Patescibacteria group bacterium]
MRSTTKSTKMTRRVRRLRRWLRQGTCLCLLGLTAVLATLVGTPAWAPEDPWRLVAEVPIVRGPEAATALMVAEFLNHNGVRLPAGQLRAIAQSVAEESRRQEIDPRLLLAVIFSESRFRTDAVSEKGAIGLMQLLPSTAEDLAAQLDLEWGGDARLLDPRTNIALGAYYLKQLMDTFDDNVNLALTAYNKGPGYVQKMQASGEIETTAANFPSSYAERVVMRMDSRSRKAL